jgi:ubiquitin carboxyl-terminal hydrolase 34
VAPFLHITFHFLNLIDQYQDQRIQWLLGFPQPALAQSSEFTILFPHALIDQSTVYPSTFEDIGSSNSILNLIYFNRKRYENYAVMILKCLLYCANNNIKVFGYLLQLPPPAHLYAKYTDWCGAYISNYLEEGKKYGAYTNATGLFNRVTNAEECQQQWEIYAKKLEETMKGMME